MDPLYIAIPDNIQFEMVSNAQKNYPEEACGLLAGSDSQVARHYSIPNSEHSKTRYTMQSRELVGAMKSIEDNDLELVAIYHSHPDGTEVLSVSDLRENNYPGLIQIVVSLTAKGWQIHPYFIDNDGNILTVSLL